MKVKVKSNEPRSAGKRQVLLDLVLVRMMQDLGLAQTATVLRGFSGKQMALTRETGENFAAGGDLKPLGHGLFCLDSLRTTHVKTFPLPYAKERAVCG